MTQITKEFWSALLTLVLMAGQFSQLAQALHSSLSSQTRTEARRLTELSLATSVRLTTGLGRASSYRSTQTPQHSGPFQLSGQSFTLMPDGRWLVLGGNEIHGTVNAAWLLDVTQGSAEKLPDGLLQPRAWHTATLLSDGTVLIIGGLNKSGQVEQRVELFRPATRKFAALGGTALTPRAHHTATLLTDGQVLIIGGTGETSQAVESTELFDVRSNHKIETDAFLHGARQSHNARLLPDGNVYVSGGVDPYGQPISYGEVFDPSRNLFRIETRPTPVAQDGRTIRLEASIPGDNDRDVPVDAFFALRFSRPLAVRSANARTVQLSDPNGTAEVKVVPAENGMLVFVTPNTELSPDSNYTLSVRGLEAAVGSNLPDTDITFTTAAHTESDKESGTPNASKAGPVAAELPPLRARPGVTALAGRALMLDGAPLVGVTFRIDSATAKTDGTGRFL